MDAGEAIEMRVMREFLMPRLDALTRDVHHCLRTNSAEGTSTGPAPFPALLLCFSTIDLLGALYCGDASKRAPTTEQARAFMLDCMNYSFTVVNLLQSVFRHKLVHLAEPAHSHLGEDGKKYFWQYDHVDRTKHLAIDHVDANSARFCVGIVPLAEDIVGGVYNKDGYLDKLRRESVLQSKCKTAMAQLA